MRVYLCLLSILFFFSFGNAEDVKVIDGQLPGQVLNHEIDDDSTIISKDKRGLCGGRLCSGYNTYPITRTWAYALYPIYVRTYTVRAVTYPVYSRCLFDGGKKSEIIDSDGAGLETNSSTDSHDMLTMDTQCKRVLQDVEELQKDEMVEEEVNDIMNEIDNDGGEPMEMDDKEDIEPMTEAEKRNLWWSYPYGGYGLYGGYGYYPYYYSYPWYGYGYRYLKNRNNQPSIVADSGSDDSNTDLSGGEMGDDAQQRRLHYRGGYYGGYGGYGRYGYGGYGRYGYGGYYPYYRGYGYGGMWGRSYGMYGGGCYTSYCRYLRQKGLNIPDHNAVQDDSDDAHEMAVDDDSAGAEPMDDEHHTHDVTTGGDVAPARRLHWGRRYGYGGYGGYGGYRRYGYGGYGYGYRRYGYGYGGMYRYGYPYRRSGCW